MQLSWNHLQQRRINFLIANIAEYRSLFPQDYDCETNLIALAQRYALNILELPDNQGSRFINQHGIISCPLSVQNVSQSLPLSSGQTQASTSTALAGYLYAIREHYPIQAALQMSNLCTDITINSVSTELVQETLDAIKRAIYYQKLQQQNSRF